MGRWAGALLALFGLGTAIGFAGGLAGGVLAQRDALGPPLASPQVLTSANGVLALQLDAAAGTYEVAGQRFEGRLYNGAYIPPFLRLRPGDVLTVTVNNRMDEETNLHFHGLNVSPRDNGDNVFLHVHPGASQTYRIEFPRNHHPGLFWYHPHIHGRTSEQIIAGLSGGFIVEGHEAYYPFLRGLTERVLLLKHIPQRRADYDEIVTVNGQVAPSIAIRPGEAQYWRIGNIGADLFLNLELQGMTAFLLGTDGHFLRRPQRLETLVVGPGGRVDVVVVGGAPGRATLRSAPFLLEEGRPPLPEHLLATVVSDGPAADVAAAEARIAGQEVAIPRYIETVRAAPIAQRRSFTFARNAERTAFTINGQQVDMGRVDVTVRLGDFEQWTIRNEDNQLHNFHIHQTEFLVTSINGVAQTLDSLYDVITLPAAANGRPSEVTIVIPFTDPVILGRFVFHCHVVKHEDKGMMQVIEVVARP
jgi:FtsP/CotA-like multicopper oxidase with cupredoxin domain